MINHLTLAHATQATQETPTMASLASLPQKIQTTQARENLRRERQNQMQKQSARRGISLQSAARAQRNHLRQTMRHQPRSYHSCGASLPSGALMGDSSVRLLLLLLLQHWQRQCSYFHRVQRATATLARVQRLGRIVAAATLAKLAARVGRWLL